MIEISIRRRPERLDAELFVYDRGESGITNFHPEGGEIIAAFIKRDEFANGAVDLKPLAIFPESVMREIVAAFMRHAREEGYKDSGETFLKGRLGATESHLADMRRIVFEDRALQGKTIFTTESGGQVHPILP